MKKNCIHPLSFFRDSLPGGLAFNLIWVFDWGATFCHRQVVLTSDDPPFLRVLSELGGLLKFVRPFLISISKAKAARLVRSLLDLFLDMEAATGQEVELCLECIEWAKAEKRTFLRQALEVLHDL